MLIEVKVKVKRLTPDGKTRRVTETYLLEAEFFAQAEHAVMTELSEEQQSHLVEDFEVLSLKQSGIKEVHERYQGDQSYVAVLKDIFVADDGTEKPVRYKVLLWADDLTQCNERALEIVRQGYDMQIESLVVQDIKFISPEDA